MNFILDAKNRQQIKGQVKADVKMTRSVGGLSLQINCYLYEGTYVGSCIYNDLCSLIKSSLSLDENNCPQNLIDNDIPCTCPFNLPIRELNINKTFDLPSGFFELIFGSFLGMGLSQGDFDVTIK